MCRLNEKNDGRRIDPCMKILIKWLNRSGFKTVSCCCGHEKYPMTIVVEHSLLGQKAYLEILSDTPLMRKKKFYKKDGIGHHYIPAVINKKRIRA